MAALTDFLTGIADAIRAKKGITGLIPAENFASEIASIEGGGTVVDANLVPLEVTQNGTYTPEAGVHGYNRVTVNVQSSGGGEPVLAPIEITQNGVYAPGDGVDGFNQIVVNVSQNPEIEYLDTTGVEYIDTGIYPTSNTKIEIKVRVDEFQPQALFGSRRTSSSSDRFVSFVTEPTLAHCQFYNKSYDVTVPDYTGKDIVVELSKAGYYYDGELLQTVPQSSFSSNYVMYLFALNSNNTLDRPTKLRFYYCKIWQDDVLVRDYVPVNLAGKWTCLHDKVDDKLYFNNGTGGFIPGPAKE